MTLSVTDTDSQVRFTARTHGSFLTNPSAGDLRRQEQDRKPPLTYRCTRGAFRIASRRRGRAEVPERTHTVRCYSPLKLNAKFLPASSRISKDNCSPCQKIQGYSGLLITCNARKMCSSSSKIYKMPPLTIRFVRDLIFFLNVNGDNRLRNK